MSAGFIRIKNKVHTTFDFLQKKIYLNSFLVCSCNLWKKKRKIMRDIHKPGPAPDNSCQNKFFVGGVQFPSLSVGLKLFENLTKLIPHHHNIAFEQEMGKQWGHDSIQCNFMQKCQQALPKMRIDLTFG